MEHAARVTLRLIFDDPHYPDFDLDLWLAGDEARRRATSPSEAVQEANHWLARAEVVLRRPIAPRPDRDRLHAIIYDELCQGVISERSKTEVLAMIARSPQADSVIFGCTEVGLLLAPSDLSAPVIDTALVHAKAGVDFALA